MPLINASGCYRTRDGRVVWVEADGWSATVTTWAGARYAVSRDGHVWSSLRVPADIVEKCKAQEADHAA